MVLAVIAILAALRLPALARAKASARRTTCIGNLHQINLAPWMYADDHRNVIHAIINMEPIYFSYQFNNTRNVMSSVDGHASFIPIYWNGVKGESGIAYKYEPPPRYDYQWADN